MTAWRESGDGRRDRRRLLALAWLLALFAGVVGWLIEHRSIPDAVTALVAVPLMSPVALPLSLAHTFGLRPGPGAVVPLLVLFWAAVGWAHLRALQGSARWLAAASLAVVLAGPAWLVNAHGLLRSS